MSCSAALTAAGMDTPNTAPELQKKTTLAAPSFPQQYQPEVQQLQLSVP
jgi:hypothetical protein